MTSNRRQTRDQAFTLVELLIMVVVLGILAAIVVFAVGTTSSNAASASCQSDVKTIESAQETFKAEHSGAYAASITALVPLYMREAPGSPKYTITTDTTGAVTVAAAGGSGIVGGTLSVGDTAHSVASICAD